MMMMMKVAVMMMSKIGGGGSSNKESREIGQRTSVRCKVSDVIVNCGGVTTKSAIVIN
jgi:hypothetical protein